MEFVWTHESHNRRTVLLKGLIGDIILGENHHDHYFKALKFNSFLNPLRVCEDHKGPDTLLFLFFILIYMSGDMAHLLISCQRNHPHHFCLFLPRRTSLLFFHLSPQYLLFPVTQISPFFSFW